MKKEEFIMENDKYDDFDKLLYNEFCNNFKITPSLFNLALAILYKSSCEVFINFSNSSSIIFLFLENIFFIIYNL